MSTPVLLITGPMGVGKTRVAERVSDLLRAARLAHALVDVDWLDQVYVDERFDRGDRGLAIRNLRLIWPNLRAAGAQRLVLARAVEDPNHLRAYAAAIPDSAWTVCRLRASIDVLRSRLRGRDHPEWWEFTAARIATMVPAMEASAIGDVVVDTDDHDIDAVAREVLRVTGWLDGAR